MADICKDVNELDKDTREGLAIFLGECDKAGLNLKVTETYRTVERQKYLYAQGRTRPGNIVTNCDGVKNISIHQTRRAFDVCYNVRGKEYDETILRKAGLIGSKLGFVWGGSWGWDYPHFELPKGVKVKATNVDTDLVNAVNKISKKSISLSTSDWNDVSVIKLKNVPALLSKLGGVNTLVSKGVISSRQIWDDGTYNQSHVRSLLIKFAGTLK